MASLQDIKRRIKSVQNTQQITKAMKLVAAAKVKKAQDAVVAARPYAEKIEELVQRLAEKATPGSNTLLESRGEEKIAIVLVTSDKGLCGGFNGNLIRKVIALIEEKSECKTTLITIGKKGRDVLKAKGYTVDKDYPEVAKNLNYEKAASIANDFMAQFAEGEFHKIYLAYNEFKSILTQLPQTMPLLPVESKSTEDEEETSADTGSMDYIYEPSPELILDSVVKKSVEVALFRALLESAAGEHGARMTAMENATKNASEMIQKLTLTYNRARQATITRELIEIVSGADALT